MGHSEACKAHVILLSLSATLRSCTERFSPSGFNIGDESLTKRREEFLPCCLGDGEFSEGIVFNGLAFRISEYPRASTTLCKVMSLFKSGNPSARSRRVWVDISSKGVVLALSGLFLSPWRPGVDSAPQHRTVTQQFSGSGDSHFYRLQGKKA